MNEQFSEKPIDFLAPHAYPTEVGRPQSQGRPARSRLPQYLLAGLVVVAGVGILTWIKMYSASSGGSGATGIEPGPAPTAAALIKFPFIKATWDKDDDEYALEIERGHDGHFDFPFENVASEPAEIGLLQRSCDCSHLEVCLVPSAEWEAYRQQIEKNPTAAKDGTWSWTKVAESDLQGFEVPAGAKGLVRIAWQARKEPGARLRLAIKIWHQPKGRVRERSFEQLEVPIMMAGPTQFIPTRANLGTLSAGDSAVAEFTFWSATRDTLNLKFEDASDPLFVQENSPLSREECRELEKTLRKGGENTRVRTAFRLKVTVREQVGTKQLDQGPIHRTVTLLLDEEKLNGPVITGSVKGDIMVGNAEDRGKVDLKIFRAREGATREVALWADEKTALKKESQTPATLEVKLTRHGAKGSGNRVKWVLEVTAPPNTQSGSFPENSAVLLRTDANPPRYIRIPVIGNGQL